MNPTSPTVRDRYVSLLGCGWLGLPISERLIGRSYRVMGSTTRADKLSVLSSLGIEAILMRIDPETEGSVWTPDASTAKFFESPTLILGLPPHAAYGEDFFPGQVEAILANLRKDDFSHLVFVSSTSVYGANQGEVDETTALEPDSDSGRILARVEARLTKAAKERGFALTIVRPGGLVGPGRHPGLFLSGRKNLKDAASPVNLVHQLDCADAIVALVDSDRPAIGETRIYNLVANFHPTRRDFYSQASRSLEVAPPEFSDDTTNATKLVNADKIHSLVTFRFDDILASLGAKERS